MQRARLFHLPGNDFAREFRTVAIAAEVPEVDVAEVRMNNGFQGIGGRFVGEVAVAAGNALLETPGPARIVLEQFQVVIGFQHKHVGSADSFANQAGGMAKIG